MKKLAFQIILTFFAVISYGFLEHDTTLGYQSTVTLSQQANQLMKEAKKERNFVGASAGIYANGKIQWIGASGDSHKGQIPAQANMLTRIASIAKPMTAVAILQLVEKGRLELDTPIQAYLPDFPKKNKGAITIRHLLQQTSGIEAYANKKEAFPTKHYNNVQAAIQVFAHRPLAFQPGTQYAYTTYGYVVLGAIIEQVSGQTYEAYMQQNIWSVANMPNTSLEKRDITYPNKSKLYKKFWGLFVKSKQTDLSLKYPGGGIHSTVEDLLNFGKAILENKLIKQETLAMMVEDPKIRKSGNGYGMGWYLYGINPEYGFAFGHSGGQSGCNSQLFIWPEKRTIAVVLANTSGAKSVGPLTFELAKLGLAL